MRKSLLFHIFQASSQHLTVGNHVFFHRETMTSHDSQALLHGINQGHHPVLHPSRRWHLRTLSINVETLVKVNRTLTHEIGLEIEKTVLSHMFFREKQVVKQRTLVEFPSRRNQGNINVVSFFKETVYNLSW